MNENMPNHNQTLTAACPQTTEELLDAARFHLARGIARLAQRENASLQNLKLVQRVLFHHDLNALKKRELDLRLQRLDQKQRQFDAKNGIRPRRLIAIEVQTPSSTESRQ
jgi:hypothetical protein